MANAPDPLANNPAIRLWAERFYDAKAWDMPDTPEAGGEVLEARRTTALAELDKTGVPAALSSGARRSLAGGRKALKKQILGADAAEAFDQIDSGIQALKDQITAQLAIAAARGKAQAALAAAEEKFAKERDSLDQGAFTFLEILIKAAQKAMAAAVSAADFEAVEAQAKDIAAKAEEARAYGVFFDNWTRATLLLIKPMDDPAKETATTERAARMAAAAALSKTGDFDGAKAALEVWKSNLDTEDHLAAAVSFDALLCGYEANHHKRCQNILSSQLRDTGDFRNHLKDAKKLAYEDSKFPEAEAKLNALIAYGTKERAALAKFLRGFDMSMMPNAEFRNAVLAAQTKQAAAGDNDPKKALKDLKSWVNSHPAIMGQSYSTQILKALQKRYDALKQVLKEPELTDLNTTWEAHRLLAEAGDFDMNTGAPQHHAKLDQLFKLEAITDSRREMDAILRRHPAAEGYDFHRPVTDALAGANYPAAVAAAPGALEKLQMMPGYLALRQTALDLLAALPGDPADLRSTLDDAMQAADLTARGGDPAKAASDLRGVLDGTDYLDLALAMTDYNAKLAKVQKEHTRTKKYLKLPEAENALDASLKTATDRAGDDGEYGDAFLLLDQHLTLLKQVKPMATARFQVQGILGALRRAGVEAEKLDPFELRAAAAEAEAAKPDFTEARTLFDALRGDLADLSTETAEACEAADGAGSNAGHSLDRHGPDVSDEDLITRLKTGKPPNAHSDDERSYTGASSKFHSPQDWLAGRELAAQAALANGIDITETEMTFTGDPLTDPDENADFTVEHGRPIDKAYIGHKKHVRLDDSGEPISDKTYETFEEIEGLTRAYVNFIWEPELLPDETTGHPAPGTHYDEEKAQDNADYVAKYTTRHGAPPARIRGRWVMMQQYPVADGWDNETKTYTNGNPGNMIP
ncbi:hypothetical protein N6L27_17630 [Leisingera sp. SS27]|uniref:hypothetical protein n=1 Tax=Leisingera sp. SS27 TaxID=2979462 RepID=UPI00232B9FB2|nr:hypothetical protein [Leisingera sp. SS27]MDC0659824.1 hypothetical protein [Leisingera sp. SS27]